MCRPRVPGSQRFAGEGAWVPDRTRRDRRRAVRSSGGHVQRDAPLYRPGHDRSGRGTGLLRDDHRCGRTPRTPRLPGESASRTARSVRGRRDRRHLRSLFDAPTPRALARLLLDDTGSEPHPPLTAAAREPEFAPLSPAQQRIWFLNQYDTTTPTYNIPLTLHLTGHLDTTALHHALTDL
ncbi:MAG: hypothetical protein EOP28_04890, partial [Rhodococcus sp. (in: high G+C Gram-positive bacteria)]